MPGTIWKDEERRDIFILQNEYDLTDDEVHNMIGRIYGDIWKEQGRKQYDRGDIRDEGYQRWAPGRRRAVWNDIDPIQLPRTVGGQRLRAESHARVQKAAKITSGKNWLTGKNNNAITLRPKTGYVRDPTTVNERASKKSKPSQTSKSSKKSNISKKSGNRNKRAPSSTPGPADGPREDAPPQTEGSHVTLDPRQQACGISPDCAIHRYGGMIICSWNGITEEEEHVLVCDEEVCANCQGVAENTRAGELVEGLDVEESPMAGMPFVHMARDTMVNDEVSRCFSQFDITTIPSMEIPTNTEKTTIYCKHASKWELVAVLACVPEECDVCRPFFQEVDGEGKAVDDAQKSEMEAERSGDELEDYEFESEDSSLNAEDDENYKEIKRPQKRRCFTRD